MADPCCSNSEETARDKISLLGSSMQRKTGKFCNNPRVKVEMGNIQFPISNTQLGKMYTFINDIPLIIIIFTAWSWGFSKFIDVVLSPTGFYIILIK